MDIIFYYILRRFFVHLEITAEYIILEKGIILRRKTLLPIKSIVRATICRSIPARILGAEKVTLYILTGKTEFYLSRNERLDFLPECTPSEKPSFGKVVLGAFIDTRALGGIVFFILFLRKIGIILGSDYGNKLVSMLFSTAENVAGALSVLHIAVPKIAAAAGIFALTAWFAAFINKLLRLVRFRTESRDGYFLVKSGIITLYEHIIVRNSAALITVDTAFTLVSGRSPVYCRGVMIYPSERRMGFGGLSVRSPAAAFWGRCAVPLWCTAIFAAALAGVYISESSRQMLLLKTVLYSGLAVSLYVTALFAAYMKHSEAVFGNNSISVTERRGLRLYTCVFSPESVISFAVSQSIFQRFSGLCNTEFRTVSREKILLRLVPAAVFIPVTSKNLV